MWHWLNSRKDITASTKLQIEAANTVASGTQRQIIQEMVIQESCADDMDMVQCSNENCRNMLGEHNTNWFHYGCVGFNPDLDTDYYCSDDCRKNQKKRKTR